MITIIDYGAGNIGSIQNMIKRVGGESKVSSSTEEIMDATKLLLPGVGSFDYGMQKLNDSGITEVLHKKVIDQGTPILGICLGMQLMTKKSEEGQLPGLGWFDAEVKKFIPKEKKQKIPHMGWNLIDLKKKAVLFDDKPLERRFYFVHSYYVSCNKESEILTETNYINNFVSGLAKNNIFGLQFHPEKSHKFGMEIIKNFVCYKPE